MLAVAGLLVCLVVPVANAAVVQVSATVETAPMHGAGDAADDPAIWIHPTDPSKSTIIGTDKSTDGHGLVVYDLSGRELFYYPDGRMNNVDVRYNFPLGGTPVALVGVTNRVRSLDFYKVNVGDRSLTKVGSFAPSTDIKTPRGFSLYHSPVTSKYYAYVTDSGKIEQWELDGSTGSVTGRLVRKWTLGGVTEGLVADDEMKRLYVAQEDVGGIWRIGAEANDSTAGTKVVSTTETGGDIVQDIKGITIYYGTGGTGYLLAASQGSDRFHVYSRDDNRPLGAFQIVAGNGVDAVTGMDGIDVTNFGVGGPFPQGFFITQDHANDGGNQSFKLVPWQAIAAAYSPPLLVDAAYDPREIGRGETAPGSPDTTITSKPDNPTNSTSASFSLTSTSTSATFACALDSSVFTSCTSPTSYTGLTEGTHTFQVRASDTNGTDSTPASHTWKVDTTPPQTTITSDPPASTSTSPSFTFSSTETGSTFQCKLDDASYASCTSPKSYTGLATGQHTFSVKAKDPAGNTDPTPDTQSWTISSSETPGSGIVRESVSTAVNTTAATTLKIPRPAGVATGDVLVGCVSLNGGTINATTGVPAGWTPLAAVTSIANPKVYGYYKVATTSEPADYTWATSSTTSGGGIVRYSGASGLDTSAKSASGAAASSGSVPGVTTTTPNAMLVGCMSVNSTSATLSSPTGMSQVVETGARRLEIADGIQATAGASGAQTWTFSAARDWAGWLVALRPKGN
jgi:myo-inositol-hexaphosphate 3-phosphohydrolase